MLFIYYMRWCNAYIRMPRGPCNTYIYQLKMSTMNVNIQFHIDGASCDNVETLHAVTHVTMVCMFVFFNEIKGTALRLCFLVP